MITKFFLNVSKEEQKKRFLERIDRPEKNWKFSTADAKERAFWDDTRTLRGDSPQPYQHRMGAVVRRSPPITSGSPTRRAAVIVRTLKRLNRRYPEVAGAAPGLLEIRKLL